MKKLLITGASGYLGGRLLEYFARQKPGWEVFAIDRSALSHSLKMQQVDAIVHAAGLDAASCANNSTLAHEVNVELTRRLLHATADARVGQFIFLSTVHVYGSPLAGRLEETLPLPNFEHPYAATKKAAEEKVLFFNENSPMKATVLRLTNAFGCPVSKGIERWDLLVNDLCKMAVTEGRLTLRSSGKQRRDFVTATNVCRAMGHVLENGLRGCYNLGSGHTITLLEMAELIADRALAVLGFRPEIVVMGDEQEHDWPKFEVPMKRLEATGFALLKNGVEEIERTLLFCKDAFG